MSVDFPRAWQIARTVPWDEHDPDCSFSLTRGGILCDCAILTQHPDYLDDVMQGAHHVLHRCDNPPCARPSHLFLGTHADNMRDMSEKGRRVGNGRVPKLSEDDVREIRRQRDQGRPRREIAAQFGISLSYCIDIGRGARRLDVAS